MFIEWQGQQYEVPTAEPPQDRNLGKLWAPFRIQLEAYVADAQRFIAGELRIGECRRSLERQVWLLSLGRGNPGPERSWTLSSRHRYGMAADLYCVDRLTGEAIWDGDMWLGMYENAPPLAFGLTTISKELVHLESSLADVYLARAGELGLEQT